MTTAIKVKPVGHRVLVEIFDKSRDTKRWKKTDYKVLEMGVEEQTFYSTTTRCIRITDLENQDAT